MNAGNIDWHLGLNTENVTSVAYKELQCCSMCLFQVSIRSVLVFIY